jgi:hypothetical protein
MLKRKRINGYVNKTTVKRIEFKENTKLILNGMLLICHLKII